MSNLEMRPSNHKPEVKILSRPEPSPLRTVGLGITPDMQKLRTAGQKRDGLGSLIDWINDSIKCPIWNMPVIEQVRWTMLGPQTDQSVNVNFGAEIDLFASGKSPVGIDFVETTMAMPGELQVPTLACAIFFHIEPEPLCWTAFGNAWTHPASSTATGIPISPDVFTYNDLFNGAISSATSGASPTQSFLPAVCEWGWWANYAAWHMARGYNLRWKVGQHTNIMDEVLRHTAFMPMNAQEGTGSSSEVDIVNFVNRMNTRYDALGSPLNFLKVNRVRVGSVLGTVTTNLGVFRPSNDDILVPATYGGMDLRSLLHGNSEFRKLTIPYMLKPGIPIGLVAEQCDTVQAKLMQAYLALSQSGGNYGGVFPATVTDDPNIGSGFDGYAGTATAGLERTLDGFNVQQQVSNGRAVFKGGDLKVSLGIKGFEVTEDWASMLQSDPDLKAAVMGECGVRFA